MCADELIMLESVRHASNDIYIYMTSMWFNQHTCCKPQRKRIKRRVLQTYIYEYTFPKDCASRYPEGVHPNIREYSKNAYASTKELTLSKRSSGATCDLINMLATTKKQSNQSNVIRNMSICVSFWHALLGSLNYTYDSIRTGCDTRGS